MSKKHLVYLHRNKINGKCYVGETSQKPTARWGSQGQNYRQQECFYNAIQKYGWDNFEHIILEENIPTELISEREAYWAGYYHAIAPEGYTLKTGIGDQIITSEEFSKMRSRISKEVWQNPEYRKKISDARKKEWENPEVRNKCLKNLDRTGKGGQTRSKKVRCIETGKIYVSTREAERQTGTAHSGISQVCNGIRKTANGFHWEYI